MCYALFLFWLRLLSLFFCDFCVNFLSFGSGEKEELPVSPLRGEEASDQKSDAACTADAVVSVSWIWLLEGEIIALWQTSIDELLERLLLDLIFYGFLLYKYR